MIRLDPPGTFCQIAAIVDMLDRDAATFADVGCGSGSVSRELCRRGLRGIGIDLSEEAVGVVRTELADEIATGKYRVVLGEVTGVSEQLDVAVSMMVAEHVPDDAGFVRDVARLVRPRGQVIIGVPGRRDHWGYEDEVVGHLRRYERADLERLLVDAGLEEVRVWSVAVPVANILFRLGNRLVERSTPESVTTLNRHEQTTTSGIREVPWKTVFPRWCRLILNRWSLAPLFLLQRAFYRTSLGITLIGHGRVPAR